MAKFQKGNIYILNFEVLITKRIVNWKHNRPPDDMRIREISRGIVQSKQCDGIIYVARIDGILVCYDGIHRHEAIKQSLVADKTLSNLPILVFELHDATEDKVLEHFRILNRCIPVPELYMGNQASSKIEMIERVVAHYFSKFPQFFSTSRSPRVPNENKDIFRDKLSEIYDKKTPHNYDVFANRLEVLNSLYRKKFLESKTTSRNLQKCVKFEFYLFFKRDWQSSVSQ